MEETRNTSVQDSAHEVEQPETADQANDAGPADDVEKWRRLSRENEKRWKQASKELDEMRRSQMTEQEKAIEAAKEQARKATLSEVGTSLVEAEIRVQAASAGVTAPTDYLDLARFVADDGRADQEKVKEFIASLPKPQETPEFPQLMGAGYHRGGNSRFSSMDPNELANFIAGDSFI
ncbi:hypothetical protein [Streptomyces sp. NPDC014733]|uniref:hypothetical protein n=1 Tax=Streptomyces sp. NPDC014733 TaxID=3364885 RepID=UPI0036FC3043